jgi:multiple sugar transport system permease protein
MARVTDVSSDVSKSARFGMWFERRMPRLFVLPAVILLLSLGLFPLLYSLGISFTNWNLQDQAQRFIGLKNYADVLGDHRMWNALGNTLIFMSFGVVFELVFGLALAQTLVGRLPGKRIITPLLICQPSCPRCGRLYLAHPLRCHVCLDHF